MKERPLLVVLTPVLNEAWILPAFLKATSLWADYIIIADQMSTDGSREIYARFKELKSEGIKELENDCQLIVVDNPRKEMHQSATRQLLFDAAKKIEGDKIFFAMDADEFLSGNFMETEGWKNIINSEPGDLFCFSWMNLNASGTKYGLTEPYYWAAHVNEDILSGTYPERFIHEWRLPWPKHENHVYTVKDILFIHFGGVNEVRVKNKGLFYLVSQYTHPDNKRSTISLYRQYHDLQFKQQYYDVPENAYDIYTKHGVDIWANIDLTAEGLHHVMTVQNKLNTLGASALRKLDIWDEDFLHKYKVKDPRRPIDKLMHWYLRHTNKWARTYMVRAIDYVLKRIY